MFDIDENVLSDLKKGFNLPPKPELLTQLQQAISEQEPNLNHIADIVNGDVAIAAAVIKVINSPFYGLARTVTDIKQAVMFLGLDSINHLVTGFLIKQAFNQSQCCISLERFWDSATEIAHIATVHGHSPLLRPSWLGIAPRSQSIASHDRRIGQAYLLTRRFPAAPLR